jgi:hypothetical protein
MSDTTSNLGYGKVGASIASAWLASYCMTQLSLHGVDFAELGVSSEIVKSTVIGTLVGFFTWLTPQNIVNEITSIIIFCKNAIKQWRNAINNPQS